ncbi:hypothetical protein JCM33374_g134 [Metschnikowia sp. JCM 33374]|nr:hypothetical protein JCM33374_g134 [Metschnikowia sp. JCM 33374]
MNSTGIGNGIRQYSGLPEAKLNAPLVCHIIQMFNVSESKEKALEEWKYYQNPNKAPFERMEHVSRPIIYGVDMDTPELEQKARTSKATYKFLLRDSFGNYFYGVELEELPFLRSRAAATKTPLPVPLGGRMVLQQGTLVAEGIALLKRNQCTYSDPDPVSELTRLLNDGIVDKAVELIEKLLKESR